MTTLVTGATGLVGNNLVRMLLARGERVRVLVRQSAEERPLAGLDVERIVGDVRDLASVRRGLQGADRVIHAAARVHIGWTDLELQQAINIEGSRNVAQAAREAGARMVHVSSVDALGVGTRESPGTEETPTGREVECPYVLTKRGAERAVLDEVARGLWAAIVNPTYILGPWDWKPSSGRMLLAVAKGSGLFAPPGGNDFCDVRDVVEGILAAFERGQPGRRYILGGDALSYFEAWTLFAEVTGGRKPLRTIPAWVTKLGGRGGTLWGNITGREPDINTASAAMAAMPHHFSSRRAQEELGYTSRGAAAAARAAWEWFQAHGYA
ncbi:MAG: NAD-dependent epimerase/dehydratase family protein [Planctomycetaceae bacterium]|nr:NAD-dependent epimerase/dehydratase family protein [Planctomycetaceae bacterium]